VSESVRRRMTRPERRRALLDAAAELLGRDGASSVTFEAMAAALGVAKTLPYAYFPSTDEVLAALFDETIGPIDAAIVEVVAAGDVLEPTMRAAIDVWFDAIRKEGPIVGALLGGGAVPVLADRIRRRDARSHALWHDVAVARLGIADPAAHVFAAMLNATATEVVQLWVTRRGRRADLIDAFLRLAAGAAHALRSRRT